MPGVAVTSYPRIESKASGKLVDAIADIHRIIFTIAEVELLRAFLDR
jgi:hypothetical protein